MTLRFLKRWRQVLPVRAFVPFCFLTPLSASALELEPSSWISGFVVGVGYGRDLNERNNPQNRARVPTQQLELAVIMDLKPQWFEARVRLEEMRVNAPAGEELESDWDGGMRLVLQRLFKRWWLTDDLAFTVGKLNESFDEGISYHPLDFFEDNFQTLDFDDKRGRTTGFPMVVLTKVAPTWSAQLFYSDDRDTDTTYRYVATNPGFNRGFRQVVAAWRGSFDWLTLNAVAQRPIPGDWGLGGSLSYVLGSSAEFHGAWFAQRGSRWPVHRNVQIGRESGFTVDDVYINESPVHQYRIDDGRLYQRWLIGGSWTSETLVSILVEFSRDERGMTPQERDIWKSVATFHDNLANPAGRAINLAYDSEALRVRGRDQLFIRLGAPLADSWDANVGVVLSRDRSLALNSRFAYGPGTEWEGWVDLWYRGGSRWSEFGSVPERSGLALGVRVFF